MPTSHRMIFSNASRLQDIDDESLDLVVTSPPYPMIAMWDEIMAEQNPAIRHSLETGDGAGAFELMHLELDKVWRETIRVIKPGGMICINIGDAARTIKGDFTLYNNHSRIVQYFCGAGMTNLPNIVWRKATNAPNKFMGSGMLPAGAYVTLEHEYILLFRKGGKREYTPEKAAIRKKSAYFWEERNAWFSDLWTLTGTSQPMKNYGTRLRNGAYPFEIPYRLINMFSIKYDVVLDPFAGTGTTMLAAMAAERNSLNIEIDPLMKSHILDRVNKKAVAALNNRIRERLNAHSQFVQRRKAEKGSGYFKYINDCHRFPVMTSQETALQLNYLKDLVTDAPTLTFKAHYEDNPVVDFAAMELF